MMSLFEMKKMLHPDKESTPDDDFRILQSWAEYEDDSSKEATERNLDYLCYELETMDPDTGERTHYYKAIKFAQVVRLPADAKQSLSFMDMQQGILSGVHERNMNLITIIANMIRPVPIGILYLYGIQGIADNVDDAKEIAKNDFLGFIGMMQGTFPVLEIQCLESREAEWLREKMYNMDYLTVIRGIPKANKVGVDAGNKGVGGANVNPDSQGTLEELITGMADYEYVLEVLSTPVYMNTLMGWQRQSQMEMTEWYGQMQGTKNLSMSVSIPMMYMANASQSQGWNRAYTDANTVNYSQGESFTSTQGQSVGESLSQTFGQTFGQTYGQTLGQTYGETVGQTVGETVGRSIGESFGQTLGVSQGQSLSNSISQGVSQTQGISLGENFGNNSNISSGLGTNYSEGVNQSAGTSENASFGQGTNYSQSEGYSAGSGYNISQGENVGTSHNVSQSENIGYSQNQSINIGENASVGTNASQSSTVGQSSTYGSNYGTSSSASHGVSGSYGGSSSESDGWSIGGSGGAGSILSINGGSNGGTTAGTNWSNGYSDSATNGVSSGYSESYGANSSNSVSYGNSASQGVSLGYGESYGMNQSYGASETYGTSVGESLSQGWSVNESNNISQSLGNSVNLSNSIGNNLSAGTSQNQGLSQNLSQGYGENYSQNWGQNYSLSGSETVGQTYGENVSQSASESYSQNVSDSYSRSLSNSYSQSLSNSFSESLSQSASQSASQGYGVNTSQSNSVSNGQSTSKSNGTSQGLSAGTSGTANYGTSSSMGLSPSIGYSKSYQWLDQGVKDLLELMEFQNERIKKALRGQGAFYTYVYMACPSLDALSTAQAIAKSTWHNEMAMTEPLQVLELTETEQKHLLYHFCAFSSDVTKEDVFGVKQYKYCTVLLPEEYVAYTHLPRVTDGGIFTIIQDIPKFSVPSDLKGEIYMGTILNAERHTFKNGYKTQFDYRIDESNLMHGFFTGASRSGKTVAAIRFVAELSRVRRKMTGKRLRIVAMDPKQDWRTLARFVEPERFKFYSMGNTSFHPIHINVWKIPRGVVPQVWIDGIIDIYCRAYGLLERGKQMIAQVVYELYEDAGVFKACDQENWKDVVPELSSHVTFVDIYKGMEAKKKEMEGPGKSGNDTKDAYARLLDRLSCFDRKYSIECQLYGGEDGIGIDELIGDDDVTVLESKGLENTFKNFIFGAITSGFYKFALAHDGGFLADDQYETVLVIEEANEILTGNDTAGTGGGEQLGMSGQSEFEQILDQAAGYGLFIFAITQKISDMPSSIIANSGIMFCGRLSRQEDVSVCIRSLGREERIDDRDLVKWFPRCPTGWFICKTSRTMDFKDSEPVLVNISPLNIERPSNQELDEILLEKKANEYLSASA